MKVTCEYRTQHEGLLQEHITLVTKGRRENRLKVRLQAKVIGGSPATHHRGFRVLTRRYLDWNLVTFKTFQDSPKVNKHNKVQLPATQLTSTQRKRKLSLPLSSGFKTMIWQRQRDSSASSFLCPDPRHGTPVLLEGVRCLGARGHAAKQSGDRKKTHT